MLRPSMVPVKRGNNALRCGVCGSATAVADVRELESDPFVNTRRRVCLSDTCLGSLRTIESFQLTDDMTYAREYYRTHEPRFTQEYFAAQRAKAQRAKAQRARDEGNNDR